MNVYLLEQNNLEGRALSFFLAHNGHNVIGDRDLEKMPPCFPQKKNYLCLILDTEYSSDEELVNRLETITNHLKVILLGKLCQLYWLDRFPTTPKGFICKKSDAINLLFVLNKPKLQRIFLDQRVKSFLKKSGLEKQRILFREEIMSPLTDTELMVLREVGNGKTTRQIAGEWYKSTHTINNHRKNILKKIKRNGTYALLTFCIRNLDAIRTLLFLSERENK